ncbi:MAG: HupE/UreJ family protein, partial [Flavobacterium sp.]
MGLKHVLDITAYDHVVFLIALLITYTFKYWKRGCLLLSFFT